MANKYASLFALTFCAHSALALHCPTKLGKEHDGYWVSAQAPGWRSAIQTDNKTTVNTADFGGAIFVPSQHRLACVYRTSKGYWITLISHTHKHIQIDRHQRDDSGEYAAWRWDEQTKDFSCGRPYVKSYQSCTYTISH